MPRRIFVAGRISKHYRLNRVPGEIWWSEFSQTGIPKFGKVAVATPLGIPANFPAPKR